MASRNPWSNFLLVTVVLILCCLGFSFVEGADLSFAVTNNIGDCARTCLNSSCLLIFWNEKGLSGASTNENCGPQPATLNNSEIKGLSNRNDTEQKVYMNDERNGTSLAGPDCATFVYIKTGTSLSFSTPAPFNFGLCSIVLVTDENSTLSLSGNLTCNSNCSCADSLKFHNSLQFPTRAAVTACLEAHDNQTTSILVTSGPGAYLVLELSRTTSSLASFSVIAESLLDSGTLPSPDELVRYGDSYVNGPECHGPRGYVPLCLGAIKLSNKSSSVISSSTGSGQRNDTKGSFGNATENTAATTTTATTTIIITTDSNIDSTDTTTTSSNPSNVYNGKNNTSGDNNNNNNNTSSDNNNSTSSDNNNNTSGDNNYNNNSTSSEDSNNNNKTTNNSKDPNNSNNNTLNSANKQVSGGSSSELSPGIIAGIAVACLLGLALVGVLTYFAFWRHKTSKVQPGFPSGSEHVLGSQPPAATAAQVDLKGTTAI